MAERGALLKAQFLSTAPRKAQVEPLRLTCAFCFVVDSREKLQITAGSREERRN